VTAQLRAELLKIRTTRTTVVLALSLVALVLLIVVPTVLVGSAEELADEQNQRGMLGLGSLAGLFGALVGLLLVTSEFRYGTIRPTFLVAPRRGRVIVAKVLAGLLAALLLGAIGVAISFTTARLLLAAQDATLLLDADEAVVLVIGTIVACGFWGATGAAVGTIVRNQVGAVVGLLAWIFVVEGVLFLVAPSFGRLLPGPAGQAITGDPNEDLLSPAAGGAVLVGWTVVLTAIGIALVERRDVD
jgi:ABC-type transport system involved in multi-copper enzyme maturation permease subunit